MKKLILALIATFELSPVSNAATYFISCNQNVFSGQSGTGVEVCNGPLPLGPVTSIVLEYALTVQFDTSKPGASVSFSVDGPCNLDAAGTLVPLSNSAVVMVNGIADASGGCIAGFLGLGPPWMVIDNYTGSSSGVLGVTFDKRFVVTGSFIATPEPSTLVMIGVGLSALAFTRRRAD